MGWVAPEIDRIEEPFIAGERTMLAGWLDFHRTTLLWKCAGLTGEQLARRAVPPSSLSLLGLIRHNADVERSWFRRYSDGEDVEYRYWREDRPDAAFEEADAASAEQDYAALTSEWALARAAVAGHSLDDTFVTPRGNEISLRWVYVHMIEEYARHNGHADLLRERIDGSTGF
jgi:uncharacterized damage-inducible protein DinB